jgi:hypothetical protein
MDAEQAISLTVEWIRTNGIDYPTEDLVADRFEVGWSVYAPVTVDESDPMAFLDIPVGRSVFLVGDSGRIKEVTTSTPPPQARAEFAAEERAAQQTPGRSAESEYMEEFKRRVLELDAEGPSVISDFTIVDAPPEGSLAADLSDDAATAAEASRLIEPIVQELAELGPSGWERFTADFAFTVSAEVAQLRFFSGDQSGLVPVPKSIAELVRRQREVAAQMPAGPWWRLLLAVTNQGETTVDYDYGDDPFPDDQMLLPEHYREDLETYPRPDLPVWLAGYVAGPAAQGRNPQQAAAAAAADTAARRTATATDDIPPLPDLWARLAVLSATYIGAGSEWGPRIYPGYGWYENDKRSGATLFVLPGDRAVLSGGKWNSELLDAAYNRDESLPDLYTGAPAWVNDGVLNTRVRNGLLTFCFWWANDQWYRGATDTSDEVTECVPPIWTPGDTIQAMASVTGSGTENQCEALLTAAINRGATRDDVAAIFTNTPDADVDTAANQLSLAGLLGT